MLIRIYTIAANKRNVLFTTTRRRIVTTTGEPKGKPGP